MMVSGPKGPPSDNWPVQIKVLALSAFFRVVSTFASRSCGFLTTFPASISLQQSLRHIKVFVSSWLLSTIPRNQASSGVSISAGGTMNGKILDVFFGLIMVLC